MNDQWRDPIDEWPGDTEYHEEEILVALRFGDKYKKRVVALVDGDIVEDDVDTHEAWGRDCQPRHYGGYTLVAWTPLPDYPHTNGDDDGEANAHTA